MTTTGKPLRVGLIGVGWGSVVQTPAFGMVPAFEVAALCSRTPERVRAAGEKLGIADTSTDWRTFVQRDDLDVISICTPVDLHHEQTMAAIAAGKHVLVEKPVGLDSGQTGEMLAAANDAGVAHAVCFEGRWEPARLATWDLVRAGHLGQPYLATARTAADYWHPTRSLQSEWMYRKDEGGGYLMGMASHDIDFMCALFGEPESVCADVRTTVRERPRPDGSILAVDADDTGVLLMRMRNGMLVTISTTAVAFQRSTRGFEAYGSGKTTEQAYDATKKGGMCVVVGITSAADKAAININQLVYAEKTLRGSIYGTTRPRTDLLTLIDMHRAGQLKLDELVTARYPLADINEAYDALQRGEVARSLIVFE